MSLKEYMCTYSIAVSDLVAATGFSRQYVSSWIHDPDLLLRVNVSTFHVVADALNVDMETLYRMVCKSSKD